MAVLTPPANTGGLFEFDKDAPIPPAGTYVATCIDCKDAFGVQRKKFENPSETETRDVTQFMFGFRDQAGTPYKLTSAEFRISMKDNSGLYKFLTAWGFDVKAGWDYAQPADKGGCVGAKGVIVVEHKPRKDGNGTRPQISKIMSMKQAEEMARAAQAAFGMAPAPVHAPAPVQPAITAPAPTSAQPAAPVTAPATDRIPF